MTVLEPVVLFLLSKNRKKVTLDQVLNGTERPRKPVLRVMDRLVSEGFLKEVDDNPLPLKLGEFGPPRRNPTWEIINPPSLPEKKAQRVTNRDKIWRAVRMKRRFTKKEIAALTGVSEGGIQDYFGLLVAAKYIRAIGKDERACKFMLVNDAGVKRPHIRENVRKVSK